MNTRFDLNQADVRRRFDRAAATFDDADFVHESVRNGLFERLDPVVVDAATVLDLGCATGSATRMLKKRFGRARIIGVDLSYEMLSRRAAKSRWFSKPPAVQATAAALPFAGDSVDVVFANLLMPWVDDVSAVVAEVSRVLRPDGLFAFSSLGPDSLATLRDAWPDAGGHVNTFPDMHDVGDALVAAALRDPVLDVDRLTVTYENPDRLFDDLSMTGARNALAGRQRGLTGRRRFDAMRAALSAGGQVAIALEIVYGHCWGGVAPRSGGEVRIAPDAIPLRRKPT